MNKYNYSSNQMAPDQIMIRSLAKLLINNENIKKFIDMESEMGIEQRVQNSLQLITVMNLTIEESTLPDNVKGTLLSLLEWIEDSYEKIKDSSLNGKDKIVNLVDRMENPIKNIKEAFENIPKS